MKFTERGDRNEILLKSSIISLAVYENDPKKFLEENDEMRNIDHQIQEICCSQSHNNKKVEYFNMLNEIFYLLVDDKTKKKIYIGFRGNQNVKNLIEDSKLYSTIGDINGRFHSGFYNHAQKVPKQYLIEKLLEGYELILTGHSLGAAVAANIAVYFLYILDFTAQYAEKIIFIGFGCPSIVDVYFKENVEQKFKNNFVFIKNENDIVVEILEYISYLMYKRVQTNDSNLDILINFINDVLSYTTNIPNLKEKCNQMKLLVGILAQIVIPEYTHFGILYKLSRDIDLKEVTNFEFNRDYFSIMFTEPDILINKIQDHFIINYFRNLKYDQYFDDRIDIKQKNKILDINQNTDLIFNLKEENIKNLKLIQMRDYTDIELIIDKSIKNIEYLVAIKLILCDKDNILSNNETVYFKDEIKVLDNDSIYFKFNFPNQKIYDKNNNLKYKDFVFEFYSHFNSKPIEAVINSESNKFRKNIKLESYQKQKIIDNMRFDLMYLHAAFYLRALERMEDLNQNFIEVKNELLGIFKSLDIILTEIWKEKKENERVYTKNDLYEMKSLVKNYFNQVGIGNELEKSDFLFNDIKFEDKLDGFKCQIQKTINEKYGEETLLKSIIPYLYELNKRTCRIQSLSYKLKDKIFEASFYQKLGYAASGVLGVIAQLGTMAALVPVAARAGSYVAMISAEAGEAISNLINNIIDEKRFPSDLDFDRIYEIIIKHANQFKNDDYENHSLYFYEKSYDEEFVNQWSEKKDDSNLKDLVVNQSWEKTEDSLKKFVNLWSEKKDAFLFKKFVNQRPEKNDTVIFELIILNKQLREILKKYCILGSIGTKNAGKSKFVELITTQNANSDTMNTTTKSKAYSIVNVKNELIYKKAVIIDYPHSNSNSLGEKLEFYFTRFLLDHIYLIFEAEAQGADKNQTELVDLVKTNNFSGFTILFNKSDRLFTSKNPNKITFAKFKSGLTDNLSKKCEDLNLNFILFTCMDIEDGRLYESEITAMKDKGVILSDGLKRNVIEKIDSIINLDSNNS